MHLKAYDLPFDRTQHVDWFIWWVFADHPIFQAKDCVWFNLVVQTPWELTCKTRTHFKNHDKSFELVVYRWGIIRFIVLYLMTSVSAAKFVIEDHQHPRILQLENSLSGGCSGHGLVESHTHNFYWPWFNTLRIAENNERCFSSPWTANLTFISSLSNPAYRYLSCKRSVIGLTISQLQHKRHLISADGQTA